MTAYTVTLTFADLAHLFLAGVGIGLGLTALGGAVGYWIRGGK